MARTNVMNNKGCEVRRGDVYRDMISGKEVTVISVKKDEVIFDDERAFKDMRCFKFVDNRAEELQLTADDFEIKNDEFFYKGEAIVTGTLIPKEIIALVSGGVLVTAADNRKNGVINLYRYIIDDDRFKAISYGVDEASIVYEADQILAVKLVSYEDHQVPGKEEDDELETVQGINERIVVLFNGHEINTICGHFGDVYNTIEKAEGTTILITTSDKVMEEISDIDGVIFKKLVESEATEVAEIIFDRMYSYDDEEEKELTGVNAYEQHHRVDGKIESISCVRDANDNRNSLFIVTENGIQHTFNGHVARKAYGENVTAAAKNYPYCVGLEAGRKINRFYLANDAYEVVCIKVTLTEDRGYVTEIED